MNFDHIQGRDTRTVNFIPRKTLRLLIISESEVTELTIIDVKTRAEMLRVLGDKKAILVFIRVVFMI